MKGEVDIMDESNDALRQESDRPGGMFQRERSASGPTMVVGVDGSEYSRRALEWASDEAKRRGAILHIVCAGYGTWQTTPSWYDATSDEQPAQAIVDDAVALVATRHPSVITRGESRVWPAAVALFESSRSNDLLVVGARGEGGFVGLLVGSVSDECIRYADCPVVVVHAEPEGTPTPAPDDRIVVGIDGSPGSRQALRWALWEARSMSASVEAVFAWHYPRAYAVFVGPVEGYAAAQREIDAEGLVVFHAGLSPRSVYRRYFFSHPKLSPMEIDRFTRVDYRDRLALVVEDHGNLIGVARYERQVGTTAAEVAFVVGDAFQHHGIGTVLLTRLAEAAWTTGIRSFEAETLSENRAMLDVFLHSCLLY